MDFSALINFEFLYNFFDDATMLVLRFVNKEFNESCDCIKDNNKITRKKKHYFVNLFNGTTELAKWALDTFKPHATLENKVKYVIKYGNVSLLKHIFNMTIMNTSSAIKNMIDYAAYNGIDMLQFVHKKNPTCCWGIDSFRIACNNGKLKSMEYIVQNGFLQEICEYEKEYYFDLEKAVKKGYIECVCYAIKCGLLVSDNVFAAAIQYDSYYILDIAMDCGIKINLDVWKQSAKDNNVFAIEYGMENGCIPINYYDTYCIWDVAAEYDSSDVIELGIENGCVYDGSLVWEIAAKNNSVNVLNVGIKNGYKMAENIYHCAAKHGHVEALELLLFNCDEPDYEFNSWHDQDQGTGYMGTYDGPELTCIVAIENDHLDCLKCAIKNGCTFTELGCLNYAKQCNSKKCIKYLETKQYLSDGLNPTYYKSWW